MFAEEARGRIFGYILMNDSSARGVQKREYVPLGPFTSKNFATTMSPWVVTATALEPYRCTMVDRGRDDGSGNPVPLEYIRDPDYSESQEHHRQHLRVVWHGMWHHTFIDFVSLSSIEITNLPPNPPPPCPISCFSCCKNNTTNSGSSDDAGSYDVNLSVSLLRPLLLSVPMVVCRSSLRNMYWSLVQQLVHHSVTGCPVRAGDLLAPSFGSILELSWGRTQNMELGGSVRERFLEDSNAMTLERWCNGGACLARVLPAVLFPYETPGLGWRRSNRRRRRTPNSDSSVPPQHPCGHGGCALPCPRRAYPTTSITHPPWRMGARSRCCRRNC